MTFSPLPNLSLPGTNNLVSFHKAYKLHLLSVGADKKGFMGEVNTESNGEISSENLSVLERKSISISKISTQI